MTLTERMKFAAEAMDDLEVVRVSFSGSELRSLLSLLTAAQELRDTTVEAPSVSVPIVRDKVYQRLKAALSDLEASGKSDSRT